VEIVDSRANPDNCPAFFLSQGEIIMILSMCMAGQWIRRRCGATGNQRNEQRTGRRLGYPPLPHPLASIYCWL